MGLNDLTKQEKGLLLYLETRAVDYGGGVDARMMNQEDFSIAWEWDRRGFINFGRIAFYSIDQWTYWCRLSDEAWKLAHEERRARYDRLHAIRKWTTTEETREITNEG